jgi:ferric-dicitrate binding protein FerR (iron transport regulator)
LHELQRRCRRTNAGDAATELVEKAWRAVEKHAGSAPPDLVAREIAKVIAPNRRPHHRRAAFPAAVAPFILGSFRSASDLGLEKYYGLPS